MTSAELLSEVAKRHRRYDRRAMFYQRIHIWSRTAVLFLGVLTILAPTLRLTLGSGLTDLLMSWMPPQLGLDPTSTDQMYAWLLVGLPGVTAIVSGSAGLRNAPRYWIAHRTGAETLKSEAFLYAASAEKYADNPDADGVLEDRLDEIEDMVNELRGPEPSAAA